MKSFEGCRGQNKFIFIKLCHSVGGLHSFPTLTTTKVLKETVVLKQGYPKRKVNTREKTPGHSGHQERNNFGTKNMSVFCFFPHSFLLYYIIYYITSYLCHSCSRLSCVRLSKIGGKLMKSLVSLKKTEVFYSVKWKELRDWQCGYKSHNILAVLSSCGMPSSETQVL